MPLTLHAAIRYKVIDRCLRNREKIHFWKDLAEEISLEYDRNGLPMQEPSQRTIGYDINHMRSGRLGYEAPISYSKERGYYYEDPSFSIHDIKLQKHLIRDLSQAILLLKQITNQHHIKNISESISALDRELKLHLDNQAAPIIYFDRSLNEMGQFWISQLYDWIIAKQTLRINYQAFNAAEKEIVIAPYHLQEYNNRWYLAGWQYDEDRIIHLGLDRINQAFESIRPFYLHEAYNFEDYRQHLHGITILSNTQVEEIIFVATRAQSYYIDTKPLHSSQQKLARTDLHCTYSIKVFVNYEIKSLLMSYGDSLEVISPLQLRNSMAEEINNLHTKYNIPNEE